MPTQQRLSIPVLCDARTLEQKHRDMVFNLQRAFGTSSDKLKQSGAGGNVYQTEWPNEINRWIQGMNRLWPNEMRKMRQNAFTLVPADQLDLDPLGTFGVVGSVGYVPSILSRMDRQIQTLRQQMSQLAPAQPLFMLTYNDSTRDAPIGTILPEGGLSGGLTGFLKDAFQIGEDGKLKFKLHFDVRGYAPEDLEVNAEQHRVTVHAKRERQTESGTSTNEYCRTVYVPSSVDADQFECHLTNDGVLILEAPVKQNDYRSIKFDRDLQLGIRPRPMQQSRPNGEQCADALQITGKTGPSVVEGGPTKRRIHVEIPVEPGFSTDDLSVHVEANQVVVRGRKEVNEDADNVRGTFVREFTRSYIVPETVDPFSMEAQLHGNTIVLEAPLVQSE